MKAMKAMKATKKQTAAAEFAAITAVAARTGLTPSNVIAAVDGYLDLKADQIKKKGWCRIRDMFILRMTTQNQNIEQRVLTPKGRPVQLNQPITTFTMMAFPTKKLWEAIQNAYESDSD